MGKEGGKNMQILKETFLCSVQYVSCAVVKVLCYKSEGRGSIPAGVI
jgi:hypothetical protein